MLRLLHTMRDQGCPVSALYPFRPSFYGRFGFVGLPRVRRATVAPEGVSHLARVELHGPDPYTLTGRLRAWAATHAAGGGLRASGALGPVDAFGLQALQAGATTAGLERINR